jgi:hypothetical protein
MKDGQIQNHKRRVGGKPKTGDLDYKHPFEAGGSSPRHYLHNVGGIEHCNECRVRTIERSPPALARQGSRILATVRNRSHIANLLQRSSHAIFAMRQIGAGPATVTRNTRERHHSATDCPRFDRNTFSRNCSIV